MKKISSLLLCMVMAFSVFAIASCGGSKDGDNSQGIFEKKVDVQIDMPENMTLSGSISFAVMEAYDYLASETKDVTCDYLLTELDMTNVTVRVNMPLESVNEFFAQVDADIKGSTAEYDSLLGRYALQDVDYNISALVTPNYLCSTTTMGEGDQAVVISNAEAFELGDASPEFAEIDALIETITSSLGAEADLSSITDILGYMPFVSEKTLSDGMEYTLSFDIETLVTELETALDSINENTKIFAAVATLFNAVNEGLNLGLDNLTSSKIKSALMDAEDMTIPELIEEYLGADAAEFLLDTYLDMILEIMGDDALSPDMFLTPVSEEDPFADMFELTIGEIFDSFAMPMIGMSYPEFITEFEGLTISMILSIFGTSSLSDVKASILGAFSSIEDLKFEIIITTDATNALKSLDGEILVDIDDGEEPVYLSLEFELDVSAIGTTAKTYDLTQSHSIDAYGFNILNSKKYEIDFEKFGNLSDFADADSIYFSLPTSWTWLYPYSSGEWTYDDQPLFDFLVANISINAAGKLVVEKSLVDCCLEMGMERLMISVGSIDYNFYFPNYYAE